MKFMSMTPSPSGAYPPIQEGNFLTPPDGFAIVPEEFDTALFYQYSGFVTALFANGTLYSVEPNKVAYDAWVLEEQNKPVIPEAPSQVEQLRADVDFLSVMTGVTL